MAEWQDYLDDIRREFHVQRRLAEKAVAQLEEPELFRTAGDEDNSVAVLMKHVGGNLRSRWRDPFESDGEKPDRRRDAEFEIGAADNAESVRQVWETGWATLEQTLATMSPADMDRPLTIRGETLSLVNALHRSLAHTAQHVGQIILLARQWRGRQWRTLSIPRGESDRYLARPPVQAERADGR
jgi:hypothetical protein